MILNKAPRHVHGLWNHLARGARLGVFLCLASPAVACAGLSARYIEPTGVYPHGVLGDTLEWSTLEIARETGDVSHLSAAADSVFEDIAPRLWDVTGDGCPEIVAIESHQSQGARLVVYVITADKIDKKLTPHIGTRFRWLAPVGAADLDGDGSVEIALIDRPHLAKTMRVYRFGKERQELEQVANVRGLTNHRIGEDFITGGLRACTGRPELITTNANWSRIVATTFDGISLTTRNLGPFSSAAMSAALNCQ